MSERPEVISRDERHARTDLIIGKEARNMLREKHVIVFGAGGVGGGAIEALARAGIGKLTIVDNDVIEASNLNRQIVATEKTVGMPKTAAAALRVKEIDSGIEVTERREFFLPDTADAFDFLEYDYAVDAVDTVTAKLQIIVCAKEAGIPVISAMGTGNKLHPELLEVADIEKTSVCPLAKAVRTELRKRGIKGVKVVYSKEPPVSSSRPVGSISFVPPVCGMIMAGEVVKDLIEI